MLAYFDCFAGIAGDMTVAALIDLGLEEDYLTDQISGLGLKSYSLRIWRSKRRGVAGIRFEVDVEKPQPQRSYRDVKTIIEDSGIHDAAKARALAIFEAIAAAESRVHGVDKDHVHFHELGAVDSIIDVVGAAVGVHRLGIDKVVCSPLPLSRGFVETSHGRIPTPAPATLEILGDVPVVGVDVPIEMVTPTGAAIAKTLASHFGPYPRFIPLKTGYGLGKSIPKEFPNALRIVLGTETDDSIAMDRVGVIECQVDDLDPRVLGDLMDVLLARGALDVYFTPVQMKKHRPGTLVTVLVLPDSVNEITRDMLSYTTSLGVRISYTDRMVVPRRVEVKQTTLGEVRVKVVEMPNGRIDRRVEFEDVRAISRRTLRPTREILQILDRELNC